MLDTTSESILLAICINHPNAAQEILQEVTEESFSGENVDIYRAILKVVSAGGRSDFLSVMPHVKKKSVLAEVSSNLGTPENISYHAEVLNEKIRMKRLSHLAGLLVESLKDPNKKSQDITEEMERVLTSIQTSQTESYIDSKRLAMIIAEHLESAATGKSDDGHKTGFTDVDATLGGLRSQELIIIGARPSIGKTALAINLAWNLAKKKIKVGFFSSEMSALQIGKRLLSICSGVGIRQAKSGLNRTANVAVFEIGECESIFVNDTPNIRLSELVRDARLMKRKDGVDVIFVDYLSLITYDHKTMAGWEKLGEISKRLKQLSRELDVPVIALSQVGRESEGKEPTLADLRYSGAIEQDADVVMFIHRERITQEEHIATDLIISKNRNGEIGRCKLIFVPSQTKFFSMERNHE